VIWKCKHCGTEHNEYSVCQCVDARLAAIDFERKQIEKRQDELDALERDILGLVPETAETK
jgi:hypothetical protein